MACHACGVLTTVSEKWIWETVDPGRAGAAGNFSKQFKNLQVKAPGVMASEEPPADAVLLAREVIQNSWDAAAELRYDEQATGREQPDFEIDFVFDTVNGADADNLAEAMKLHEHQARIDKLGSLHGDRFNGRKAVGLGVGDYLDGATELTTLKIVERGTTGMYGPWRGRESKMYLALVSVGFTQKHAGAGGSYGFGKAGLIRGSRIRTVIAYSCFRERSNDQGVTRRLFGMTYWGGHEIDGSSFTGFARFGCHHEGSAIPFENEEADRIAEQLGLDPRDPGTIDELGTTFLLIDTDIDPAELCSAIERNWWPALEETSFTATVVAPDGKRLRPSARRQPDLLPFVIAHEIAQEKQKDEQEGKQKAPDAERFARSFEPFKDSADNVHKLGTVGIVAEVGGWSYPGDTNPAIDHRSLIALVRGPKMVVEYLECGPNVPFVRGTFLANDEIDDLLRQTEPPLHDAWDEHESSDDIEKVATEIASVVKKRIRTAVADFRNRLRPPVPDKRDMQLDLLQELMGNVFDGKGNKHAPPPQAEPRNVTIGLATELIASEVDPTMIRFVGKATISLAERVKKEYAEVQITLRYKFSEDGAAGGDPCSMDITPASKAFMIASLR